METGLSVRCHSQGSPVFKMSNKKIFQRIYNWKKIFLYDIVIKEIFHGIDLLGKMGNVCKGGCRTGGDT